MVETIVIQLLGLAFETAPDIVSAITGVSERDLDEKIKRARAAIPELRDSSEEDTDRRKRLEEILSRGH